MEKATEDKLLEAISRLEARLDELEDKDARPIDGELLAQNLNAKWDAIAKAVTDYVEKHPVRSATIAFLLGVAIASRRRR